MRDGRALPWRDKKRCPRHGWTMLGGAGRRPSATTHREQSEVGAMGGIVGDAVEG